MQLLHMADAAFAANIPPGFPIVAGYYPGAADFHPWTRADWGLFPGAKLPVTVPADPGNGHEDGLAALASLRMLGVPQGSFTALDLEERVDVEYVLNFGAALQQGYRVWPYGSLDFIFRNPPLNGYWPAAYGLTAAELMQLLAQPHVRAIQYQPGPGYDQSLVKQWTEGGMWGGS